MNEDPVKQNGNETPEAAEQAAALNMEDGDQVPSAAEAVADAIESQETDVETGDVEAPLSLEERLQKAEAQAAEYLEGWQRARAEFANARKRMEKNRMEARQMATVDVLGRLLPVVDDFERALQNVPDAIADHSWLDGMQLVERKLRAILETEKIKRIESVGQPFDPNLHEAVMQEESEEYESGVVVKELQAGYRLEDRVIRPAMVVVAA